MQILITICNFDLNFDTTVSHPYFIFQPKYTINTKFNEQMKLLNIKWSMKWMEFNPTNPSHAFNVHAFK